jgi:hypothetical protein
VGAPRGAPTLCHSGYSYAARNSAPVIALRILQVALLARATGAPLRLLELALVPPYDLLHFGAQFAPYVDDRVTSRGHPMRLGPNMVLLDAAA